ncbi:MAG TPA: hypothetical protein VH087_13430 [Thermoanaerobaculia bacterium]|jgi:hypothetical protein|nr:hypothetical protein [Thermoanaerobaculia bacterium]
MLEPEQAVAALRDLRNKLPLPDATNLPVNGRRRLGHVDPRFTNAAVNAMGVDASVQSAVGRSDVEVRGEMDSATRWTAFTDELRALLATSVNADSVRRQRIGLASLQAYKICVQLAREDKNAARPAPHIAEMKRLNKFARRKPKTAGDQTPSTDPSSSTAPTQAPAPSPAHQ